MPNKKKAVKNLPNTCKLLPKRRNFAKSGHSEFYSVKEVYNVTGSSYFSYNNFGVEQLTCFSQRYHDSRLKVML